MSENLIEQLWITLRWNGEIVLLAVMYKPPNQDKNDFINIIRATFNNYQSKMNKYPTFILGDFNEDQALKLNSDFLSVFDHFGLVQLIDKYTRIAEKSKTILGLIFTNVSHRIKHTRVFDKCISDHSFVEAKVLGVKKSKSKVKYIKFRPWNAIDQSELIETFKTLKDTPKMLDLGDDFVNLQSKVVDAVNVICPEKSVRCTKPYAPWMKHSSVIEAQRERNRFKKSYQKNKGDNDCRLKYRKAVRKVDCVIKEVRQSFLNDQKYILNSSQYWGLINKLMHKEANNSSIDPNKFITHYVETSVRLTEKNPSATEKLDTIISNLDYSDCLFHFNITSQKEVLYFLKKLKSSKIGSCGINSTIIKLLASEIAPDLTILINKGITASVFPIAL